MDERSTEKEKYKRNRRIKKAVLIAALIVIALGYLSSSFIKA